MTKGTRKNHEHKPDWNQEGIVPPETPEFPHESNVQEPLDKPLEELERFRSLAQRAQADLVNYKRRIEEERIVFAQNANNNLILKLLPIIDDFDLAIAHTPDGVDSSWSTGIEMILKKLQVVIDTSGVTSFNPGPGQEFDPSEHESAYFENSSEVPVGTIVRTIRLGYRVGARVLRPAQVIIAHEIEESEGNASS